MEENKNIVVEVEVDKDQVKELFELLGVKFSNGKYNELKDTMQGVDKESLEEALLEIVEDVINEDFGEEE